MSSGRNYNNICQNCGIKGHHIRNCPNPVTSLGVILYKIDSGIIKYLIVRRKNTIGFVEFIRGKYAANDIEYIQELFNVMTETEINLLLNKKFSFLWEFLWMDKKFNKGGNRTKRDYETAYEKFHKIKEGYGENKKINIEKFINEKNKFYIEQEWGFPKGRRNLKESDIDCAVREFEEESGYEKSEYIIEDTNIKFQEIFSGTNNIRYKHIYYLAKCLNKNKILNVDKNKFSQYSEINCIKWFNYQDGLKNIRDYNIEKKEILKKVNDYILSLKNNII